MRPDNQSYRYGDGLFETMKIVREKILLSDLHFERLSNSLALLRFRVPKRFIQQRLEKEIIDLCKKNSCADLGRVRLSLSRGNGGLYDGDEKFHYVIECWPLQKTVMRLNENGLVIDVFPHARKSCDAFSNLKSASHLIYVMAAVFAKEKKLNDSILLNTSTRVCDTTIANLFWIKDKKIFTPPLAEGGVAGVQRRYLLEKLCSSGFDLREQNCEINDLENADEVFVSNAIQGIRWVKQFRRKIYTRKIIGEIYRQSQLQE